MEMYKKLKRSDVLVDGMVEEVKGYSDYNIVLMNRRMSM